jgi:hypothetical protein
MPTTPPNPPRPPRRRPTAANAARKQQRGKPFPKGKSGNPAGKKKGCRSLASRLFDQLAEDGAEEIIKRLLIRARRSDVAAATVLARVWPAPRGRAVTFKLPPIATVEDAAKAVSAILKAAAQGEITPDEASTFVGIAARFGKLTEVGEIERRLAALEKSRRTPVASAAGSRLRRLESTHGWRRFLDAPLDAWPPAALDAMLAELRSNHRAFAELRADHLALVVEALRGELEGGQ